MGWESRKVYKEGDSLSRCPIRKDYPHCSPSCGFYDDEDNCCAVFLIANSLSNIETDIKQIKNTLYK